MLAVPAAVFLLAMTWLASGNFQTLIEFAGVIVSFAVFLVAWETRRQQSQSFHLALGLGYASVAGLDLLIALAHTGLGVTGEGDADSVAQLWMAARLIESLSLVGATAFLRRSTPVRPLAALHALAFLVLTASIVVWDVFPTCFVDGHGLTRFKIAGEYAICGALALAAVLCWQGRESLPPATWTPLLTFLGLRMAAELMFSGTVPIVDQVNMMGHLMKVMAGWYLYRATVRATLAQPFDDLRDDLCLVQADLVAARRAAAEASAAQSRFLAAANHDLRQPFQAIRLFYEVLAPQVPPPARQAAANLGEAIATGERILAVLSDIAQLDAGLVIPQVRAFPVGEVMAEVRADLAPQARQKGLTLRIVQSAAIVTSDPALLHRILRDLLVNAIRYTERGGVLVGWRRRGPDSGCLEVWDTGRGIPEDALTLIFEDFFQLDNDARDRANGMGVGLSAALRIARLLDHRIEVRSCLGRGSMFGIVMPTAHTH